MNTKTLKKAAPAPVKKAITAKKPISKVQLVKAPVTSTAGATANTTVTRLTREMLDKRQQAKGSVRKKGGAKIAEMTEKKLKTLDQSIEAGPTSAE